MSTRDPNRSVRLPQPVLAALQHPVDRPFRLFTAFVAAAACCGAAVFASAAEPLACFEYTPPPLFDTSDNPTAAPSNPRVLGVRLVEWGGSRFLIYNRGNDLTKTCVDDPANPVGRANTHFAVPPFGDRDYNLFGYSVCDDCRFGVAGFEAQGTVLFDLGTGSRPSMRAGHTWYPASLNEGGFTFRRGQDQYLVIARMPGGSHGRATLYRITGTTAADLEPLQHLGEFEDVLGGEDLGEVVWVRGRRGIHILRVTGTGAGLRLDHLGTPLVGAVAVDRTARLAVTASGARDVELWDLADPADPRRLSGWDPNPARNFSLVALDAPYLWVAARGSAETYTFDVSSRAAPRRIDIPFWDVGQTWNSIPWSANRGAVFHGRSLFVARFSVLQRFQIVPGCRAQPLPVIGGDRQTSGIGEWMKE